MDNIILSRNNLSEISHITFLLNQTFKIYLTFTRPGIAYVVQDLSQFVHYRVALRNLRYLKQSLVAGIFLLSSCSLQLEGFCDSDWAGFCETRRSITGFYLISWKSKKQATVSRSSSEVEYCALA
uniref:Retrovirus-related Pol polyprotein from transposon TNT 1-94 n=1 Tax=Cajanus cajan TaxID=3821 RepID=A0A151U9X3_CAJCA|nr:hypothetical protein KK1_020349 [Cajanus cajan]